MDDLPIKHKNAHKSKNTRNETHLAIRWILKTLYIYDKWVIGNKTIGMSKSKITRKKNEGILNFEFKSGTISSNIVQFKVQNKKAQQMNLK